MNESVSLLIAIMEVCFFPIVNRNVQQQPQQGRIHGNPVADGWAGAVMLKLLAIQKCYGRRDRPTDTARCRVSCPRRKSLKYKKKRKKVNGMIRIVYRYELIRVIFPLTISINRKKTPLDGTKDNLIY